jgi:AbrB family looped-hinge helix DNA binding protein
MAKSKKQDASCCGPAGAGMGMCNVEAFVSVDERGQMVLPKELREKANIQPGEKLVVVSCQSDGKVSVIALIRSDEFAGMVKNFLGPAMGDILNK